MTKQTLNKLDILNSMEFIEIDATSKDLLYVLVENSEENVSKIGQIVSNPEQVVNDYYSTNETIDITRLAFENCGATGFDGAKFIIESEEK